MLNNSNFFQNTQCEYFPCHEVGNQNCLFCFCPLYPYDCGGDYVTIVVDNRLVKDCSSCTIPHTDYDYVINFLKTVL